MKKVLTLFYLLPKLHRAALSLITLVTIGVIIMPFENAKASKNAKDESVKKTPSAVNFDTPLSQQTPSLFKHSAVLEDLTPKSEPQLAAITINYKIQKGDTLAAIFHREGLSAKDVYEVTQLTNAKKYLIHLIPDEKLKIIKNENGQLLSLERQIDRISTLVVSRDKNQYHEKIEKKVVYTQTQFAEGVIKTNFWNAAADAKLTPIQIMELATIFGWDIDFSLDLRAGDNFSLLYEQKYADKQFLGNGHILAAEFINQGERYTAVRYEDGHYYSETGQSLRKAFLRSPVDFRYISSNFNPKRRHPVTGSIKAHRGVDYVAPIGTPIKAAGDGRVIQSSYNKYNGNYVFIRHNNRYTTKYLHLTKRHVKKGQIIKQGQTIGTLGKTGRVTGAHLHYEFIVNGVHRNPRKISLPTASPIAKKQKAKFDNLSFTMMAKIKQNKKLQLAGKEIN